jgi:D-serine deaminase-like pyridoxal phosphate-dependent protein
MNVLSSLPTPRVAIDRGRVRANIRAMQALATSAGVRLRPHAKTHKSAAIARWQIEEGAVGICCAKLGEAEVFAAAGITDIRLPYPVQPSNADRVSALLDQTRLSIIVDDERVAAGWSKAMSTAGRTLDVLVKVDVGFHRCGVDPDSPATIDAIRRIADLPGLRFCGLLSHAGHGYTAPTRDALERVAADEIAIHTRIAGALRAKGVRVDEISVGATPTARFIAAQHGVTEMRPGNYVFFDRTQAGLESARLDDCALHIVASVVSRPSPTRAIFDAGSKTLSSDGARGFGPTEGYGLVFPSLDAAEPDRSIVIERLSEEHANVRVPDTCTLRAGDRVRILPNHSCVVVNLADELLLCDGDRVVEHVRVDARGRNT